jgi:hypothetical protein
LFTPTIFSYPKAWDIRPKPWDKYFKPWDIRPKAWDILLEWVLRSFIVGENKFYGRV